MTHDDPTPGWTELKEAFWAALDDDPAGRARRIAALASVDPALAKRLEALLEADAGGEALQSIFQLNDPPRQLPAKIGSYAVLGLLGSGGMGDVYRAHDARLHRDVAIKVLPAALTGDPERLERLEREARVLASLNHPHVAQVYGLEEADGAPALVMELVEGPTLAQLMSSDAAARPSPGRVLDIAWQIADGLSAAHEKGFVHRDLKPDNIALTAEGVVRILDFGVAKSLSGSTAAALDAGRTEAGVLLGTPAYMSPEQARGLPIDRRTDIWAFGCVLYELLTGRGPFSAANASDSLAAVLEREPDWSLLPPATPAAVRSLLRHCLEKDPNRRLRDIADARLALEDARAAPIGERTPPPGEEETVPARSSMRAPGLMMLAVLGAVALAGALIGWLVNGRAMRAEPSRIVASLALPDGLRMGGSHPALLADESRFAISPDGQRLAVVARDTSGASRLWLRELSSAVFRPLAGTEGAAFPFWSPDSRTVGFIAEGRLRTLGIDGGGSISLADAGYQPGSWSRAGLILFSPGGRTPLSVVPASGGTPRQVTTLDSASGEVQHSYPSFLPDGRHFLYFSYGGLAGGALQPRGVFIASVDGSTPVRQLAAGGTPVRYASGHLLFVQEGTLLAQPFDVDRLQLRGTPFPVVDRVKLATGGATGGAAAYSASQTGVLVYQAALRTVSQPVWYDRAGNPLGALAEVGDYGDVALSPDGRRLALSVIDRARSTWDIWLYEEGGGPGQRLTVGPGDEFAPVWARDGKRLLFSASRDGIVDLFLDDLVGDAAPTRVATDTLRHGRFANDWSGDGRFLMYVAGGRAIATSDLWLAAADGEPAARPILNSAFVETHGRIAPSGDWFVYTSNETGRMEVYVDRFPDRGARRVLSVGGGGWPRWSRDEGEVLYLSPDNHLMSVPVRITPERLETSAPVRLFAVPVRTPVRLDAYAWDVSPDGRRFLVNTLIDEPAATVVTIDMNWLAGAQAR